MASNYVAVDPATLPKRQRRGNAKEFDQESANALLAIVGKQDGATATDNAEYAEQAKARSAASKARRLLLVVAPEGKLVRTRVYGGGEKGDQPPFRWVVWFATEKPKKAAKGSK